MAKTQKNLWIEDSILIKALKEADKKKLTFSNYIEILIEADMIKEVKKVK